MSLFPADAPKPAKERKPRRKLDAYYTPFWATQALIDAHPEVTGLALVDPSSGDGRMSDHLVRSGRFNTRLLNDADRSAPATWHLDAARPESWEEWRLGLASWCISNPPFNVASAIAWNALELGYHVAFLLRLTFLEPVEDRQWLIRRPPTALVVLPRYSFDGSGQTDSVTCAWMIWGPVRPGIKVVRAEEIGQMPLTGAA